MSFEVGRGGEGLSDSLRIDFADPESRTAGLARVESEDGEDPDAALGILLAGDAAWRSADPEGVEVADDGERVRASLSADAAGFEIEATRLGGASFDAGTAFADATGVSQEVFAVRAAGEWHAGGSGGRLECPGTLVRSRGALDWNRLELVRSLTAVLDDGTLLAVAAARPAGAAGHGDEVVSAVLLDPEDALTRFDDPLLSTEYDAEGRQRRVGAELWSSDEDAAPLRGAGTLFGTADGTAFLRFTLDGSPGTATYVIQRPPR